MEDSCDYLGPRQRKQILLKKPLGEKEYDIQFNIEFMEAIDSKEEIKLSACKQSNRVGQSRLVEEKQICSSKKRD